MDRLSSCYFCGIALDEPLRDYPVASEDGEPTAVVTLCPTCHRKLETVLNAVDSATDRGDTAPAVGSDEAAELEGDEPAALVDADSGSASESGSETAEEPIAMGADGPADAGEGREADEEDSESQADDGGDATDRDAGVDAGEGGDGENRTADGIAEAATTDADEMSGMMEPDVPEALRTDESRDGTDANGTGTAEGEERDEREPDPDGSGDVAASSPGEDDEGGDRGAEPETKVSALEYNKVMRLLQNREFPVDRGEIVTVAASAYELAESDCAAVIDLAVDRGLIGEEDGKLVRPDETS
ncbi:MAG: hypothetical protein ABEH56_01815 [Salinirussus sp.]